MYFPHRKDWNFLGEGGSLRPKNFKKCMELNWNFQRGGEVLGKIPSVGELGMDIFWNYTINNYISFVEIKNLVLTNLI